MSADPAAPRPRSSLRGSTIRTRTRIGSPSTTPGRVRFSAPGRLAGRSPGRTRARRRQVLAWLVVALVAVAVQRAVASARAGEARWRGDVEVLVVVGNRDAGSRLDLDDVRVERRPSALVPAERTRSLPRGATAAVRIPRGTVLTDPLLRRDRRSATARALPPGTVAVVVRTGDLPRLAEPGDRVDVAAPTWDGPVATGATVIRTEADSVTLAVAEDDAAATSVASLAGAVALVVRP